MGKSTVTNKSVASLYDPGMEFSSGWISFINLWKKTYAKLFFFQKIFHSMYKEKPLKWE
jgi:hypothetical protein